MIKKIAWDTFKNTGDINTFLEYKQIEDIEKGIKEIQEIQKITDVNIENINKIILKGEINFKILKILGGIMANIKINGIVIAENNMGD